MSVDNTVPDDQSSTGGASGNVDSIVLEEEIDPNYVPTEDEVVEYAKWLGMDLDKDGDLFWVAKEGLMAPLPKNWKPCKTKETEDIYYFNFATGESTWDHPCDGYYKRLFEEEKKKKETERKESSDENRKQAKADVEKLVGKTEKPKKKKKSEINSLSEALSTGGKSSSSVNTSKSGPLTKAPLAPIGGGSTLEKKPLPGINPPGASLLKSSVFKNSQSDISLLTVSDGSGSIIKESNRQKNKKIESTDSIMRGSVEIQPTIDEGSSVSSRSEGIVQTKRSKMSARLSSVLSISDENQLDTTPSKSENYEEAEAKQMFTSEKEAKITSAKETSQTEDSYNMDTSKMGVSTKVSNKSDEAKSVPNREFMEDVKSSSRSNDRQGDDELRSREQDIINKDLALELLKVELSDANRRLSRSKQNQIIAEETEAALQRQLQDMKGKLTSIEAFNEQLEKENKDLRISSKGSSDGIPSTNVDDSSLQSTIMSLKEEIKINESSLRRSNESQKSLREEMDSQVSFYKSKIKSGEKSLLDAKEDIDRFQNSLKGVRVEKDELVLKHNKEMEENGKINDDLSIEITKFETKLNRSSIDSSNSVDTSKLRQLTAEVAKLNKELSNSRVDTDDARARLKRSEQLVESWESDCDSKETRLVQARKRSAEMEDKVYELESEKRSISAKVTEITKDLDEAQKSSEVKFTQEKEVKALQNLQNELENKLKKEGEANLKSESLLQSKSAEIEKLKSDLEKVDQTKKEKEHSDEKDVFIELATAMTKISNQEIKNKQIAHEAETLRQRIGMLTEKNDITQTELDNSRELYTLLKNSRSAVDNNTIDGRSQEQIIQLEKDLFDARKALQSAASQRDIVQIKLEAIASEMEILKFKNAKGEEEYEKLSHTLKQKVNEFKDLEGTLTRNQLNQSANMSSELSQIESDKRSRDLLMDEVGTLRSLLNQKSTTCNDLESALSRSQQQLITYQESAQSKALELAETRLNLESEQRARHTLSLELDESKNIIFRLRNELESMRIINADDSNNNSSKSAIVPGPPAPTLGTGMMELGLMLGQQTSAISIMENKLKEAMETISKLQDSSKNKNNIEIDDVEETVDLDEMDKSSLIREMLLEFIQKRKPLSKNIGEVKGREYWNPVIQKESKFIAEARRVLKEEKVAIRWEQQLLLKRRENFKNEKQNRSNGAQALLNQQTAQLNHAVEQAKHTANWLNGREHKLEHLQQLVLSTGNSISIDQQIEQLVKEMDTDNLSVSPFQPDTLEVPFYTQQLLPRFYDNNAIPLKQMTSMYNQLHDNRRSHFSEKNSHSRNTFIDAQSENRRPLQRVSENMQDNTRGNDVNTKQEHRKAAAEVKKMEQERASSQAAYDGTMQWLSTMRQEIGKYKAGSTSQNAKYLIDSIVQEKYEL